MDAFFASVEQRDFPQYKGLPLVVGGKPDRRGVVAAASYEARKYGIHSAMSCTQALQRCPDLIFLPPRFDAYQEVSQQIRRIFQGYTDLIEPLSLDEAYLDVTENKVNQPSATKIAQEIKQLIFEETSLTASAGVSYNKFLAKTASDVNKPNGLFVITPAQAPQFLAQLPIQKFYGVGKVTASKMKGLGIETGADLIHWSVEALSQHFGKSALYYYQIVRGVDDRPVESEWIRKSIGAESTFEKDLLDIDSLKTELKPLLQEVWDWLVAHQQTGRTLTLKVKYFDFEQITRSQSVAPFLASLDDCWELLSSLLIQKTLAGKKSIRLLGVSISNLEDMNENFPPLQLRLPFKPLN
ncbi:MAG: DNA polymerase IV [Cyanobacteria bacterium]|nr:DNA polymerase IV [Cyanobacteriota bacterium]